VSYWREATLRNVQKRVVIILLFAGAFCVAYGLVEMYRGVAMLAELSATTAWAKISAGLGMATVSPLISWVLYGLLRFFTRTK
jgi:hypothetical protein